MWQHAASDFSVFGMTGVSRYILRHLFWWAVLITATLTCVVWLTQSLRFVNLIISHGLSAPLFIWLTALLLPSFLLIILPISVFSAVLFAYNKLVAESELVVLRGAGFSQWALSRPALILAALTTLFCFLLSLYLVPATYREFKDLQRKYRSTISAVVLQEGVFNTVMRGITVYVRARSADGQLLGIIVHDSRNPDQAVTMMAEKGAIIPGDHGPRVVMQNGNRQEVRAKDGRLNLLNFDRYVFDIVQDSESDEGSLWRDPKERFVHELFAVEGTNLTPSQYNEYRSEAHYRVTAPILVLGFVFVGLACLLGGEFNRRGQWRRIFGAILLVIALEAGMIGVKNASVTTPELMFSMYLFALLPIPASVYALNLRPRRWRPAAPPAPA